MLKDQKNKSKDVNLKKKLLLEEADSGSESGDDDSDDSNVDVMDLETVSFY